MCTQKKSCAVDCPAVAEDGRPICSSESEARLALSRTRRLASLASLSVTDSVSGASFRHSQLVLSSLSQQSLRRRSPKCGVPADVVALRHVARTVAPLPSLFTAAEDSMCTCLDNSTAYTVIDYVTHAHIPQR